MKSVSDIEYIPRYRNSKKIKKEYYKTLEIMGDSLGEKNLRGRYGAFTPYKHENPFGNTKSHDYGSNLEKKRTGSFYVRSIQ